ncbi:MAG: HlyD family secretion protein, partial [Thermoanaerobaculia bacterium]|nr:HlyD family secretion protein [Thermoanaerobaculia bacterium]
SVMLRMVFRNPRLVLLPGMFVRAIVTEGVEDDAILVPQQGVTRNTKGQAIAWIVGPDEKAQQRVITVGRTMGDRWVVTDGLVPGERVIVEGLQRLRPGTSVRATEFVASSSPNGAATSR